MSKKKTYEHHDEKHPELPNMPPKDSVALACEAWILAREEVRRDQEVVNQKAEQILMALKETGRNAVTVQGLIFEVTRGKEKLKVSKV